MDDPSRRAPPPPPPEGAISPYAPAYPPAPPAQPYPQPVPVHGVVVQSLPGMPPVHVMPGVSVQIQNVVVPAPMMAPPQAPYPQPPYPQPPYPQAQAAPGVVGMMTDDAAHRTREAVARRGPARVLSFVVGGGAAALAVLLFLMIPFGASAAVVSLAALPLAIVSVVAFAVGARAGQGVASHHLEQAILRLAAQNQGAVRVVALARATGRPLRECQVAVDAMVSSGHATVEADETGALVYRVPDLEPGRALPPRGTEIMAEPPFREGSR